MSHRPIAKRATRLLFLKTIATTLILCLVFQEFSYATPELSKLDLGLHQTNKLKDLEWAKKSLPDIPESVASIEDAWKGTSNKTIILIQDAHTNSSCQLNESRLFDLLFKNGSSNTVFTEAALGNVNLTFLRNKASLSKRTEVAKEYLQKGLLHGIEYLDLTSNHNFNIEGVEDPSLYFQSLKVYKESVKKRKSFESYLQEIESTINTLEPKLLNPFLLAFLDKYNKAQKEESNLSDYTQELLYQANTLNINLKNYQNLKKLKDLKALESQIDFKIANTEQQKAIDSLSSEDKKDLTDSISVSKLSTKDSQKGYFLYLNEKIKNKALYPELTKYLNYLEQSKSLNPKDLLSEKKQLEDSIFKALTTNEDETKLLSSLKALNYYKKLFQLTLTPEEYQDYKELNNKDLKSLSGFLNKKLMDLKDHYDKAIFLNQDFSRQIELCTQFYELTYQRDLKFIENIQKDQPNTSFLITGGYHTPNLKYLLKKNNISYISITPQITHETNIKRYEEILLSQPTTQSHPINLDYSVVMLDRGFDAGSDIPVSVESLMIFRDFGFREAVSHFSQDSQSAARLATENNSRESLRETFKYIQTLGTKQSYETIIRSVVPDLVATKGGFQRSSPTPDEGPISDKARSGIGGAPKNKIIYTDMKVGQDDKGIYIQLINARKEKTQKDKYEQAGPILYWDSNLRQYVSKEEEPQSVRSLREAFKHIRTLGLNESYETIIESVAPDIVSYDASFQRSSPAPDGEPILRQISCGVGDSKNNKFVSADMKVGQDDKGIYIQLIHVKKQKTPKDEYEQDGRKLYWDAKLRKYISKEPQSVISLREAFKHIRTLGPNELYETVIESVVPDIVSYNTPFQQSSPTPDDNRLSNDGKDVASGIGDSKNNKFVSADMKVGQDDKGIYIQLIHVKKQKTPKDEYEQDGRKLYWDAKLRKYISKEPQSVISLREAFKHIRTLGPNELYETVIESVVSGVVGGNGNFQRLAPTPDGQRLSGQPPACIGSTENNSLVSADMKVGQDDKGIYIQLIHVKKQKTPKDEYEQDGRKLYWDAKLRKYISKEPQSVISLREAFKHIRTLGPNELYETVIESVVPNVVSANAKFQYSSPAPDGNELMRVAVTGVYGDSNHQLVSAGLRVGHDAEGVYIQLINIKKPGTLVGKYEDDGPRLYWDISVRRYLRSKSNASSKIDGVLRTILSEQNLRDLAARYGKDIRNILYILMGSELRGHYDEAQIKALVDQSVLRVCVGEDINESQGEEKRTRVLPQKPELTQPPVYVNENEERINPDEIEGISKRLEERISARIIQAADQEIARKQAAIFIQKLEEEYFFREFFSQNPNPKDLEAARTKVKELKEKSKDSPITFMAISALAQDIDEAIGLQEALHREGLNPNTTFNLYQLLGVLRMLKLKKLFLSDQMGLGKTLEAIATFLNSNSHEMFVAAPKAALARWMDDLGDHTNTPIELVLMSDIPLTPALQNNKLITVTRIPRTQRDIYLRQRPPPSDEKRRIILASYGILQNFQKNRSHDGSAIHTDFFVADEAHLLKNPNNKASQAIFGDPETQEGALIADYKLLLTGTPLENNPPDLLAGLKFLAHGGESSAEKMITGLNRRALSRKYKSSRIDELSSLSAFLHERMVRRTKEQAVRGLPKKVYNRIILDPSTGNYSRQRELYELALNNPDEFEQEQARGELNPELDLSEEETMGIASAKATQLLRLEQVATDPGLFDESAPSIKIDTAIDLIIQRLKEDKSGVIATDYKRISKRFAQKLKQRLLREGFSEEEVAYIDGSTPDSQRASEILDFQNKKKRIIIVTTGTTALAVNLTQADYILMLNYPWKPSTFSQMVDRAHRLDSVRNTPDKTLEIINLEYDHETSIDAMKRQVLRRKSILEEMIVNGNLTPEILEAFYSADASIIHTIESRITVPFDDHELTLLQQFRLIIGRILKETNPSEIARLWSQAAELYIQILEHKGSLFANIANIDFLSKNFDNLKRKPLKVLDLGSGPSTFLRALHVAQRRPGFSGRAFQVDKVIDYDATPAMLRFGIQRDHGQVNGSFNQLGTYLNNENLNSSFDIVNLSFAFRYAEDPLTLIRNIHSALSDQGIFTILLPRSNEIPQEFFDAIRELGFEVRIGQGQRLKSGLDRETYKSLARQYGKPYADDMARSVKGEFSYLVAQKGSLPEQSLTDEELAARLRLVVSLMSNNKPPVDGPKIKDIYEAPAKERILPENAVVDGTLVSFDNIPKMFGTREESNETPSKKITFDILSKIHSLKTTARNWAAADEAHKAQYAASLESLLDETAHQIESGIKELKPKQQKAILKNLKALANRNSPENHNYLKGHETVKRLIEDVEGVMKGSGARLAAHSNPYIKTEYVSRNLQTEDFQSGGKLIKSIEEIMEAKKRAGDRRKVRMLIIGAGSGVFVYELNKKYKDQLDLVCINKEPIKIQAEEFRASLGKEYGEASENEVADFQNQFELKTRIFDVDHGLKKHLESSGDGLFDLIFVSTATLGYIEHKYALISQIKAQLSKDGVAVINNFGRSFWICDAEKKMIDNDHYFESQNNVSGQDRYEYVSSGGVDSLIIKNLNPDSSFPQMTLSKVRKREFKQTVDNSLPAAYMATYQIMDYVHEGSHEGSSLPLTAFRSSSVPKSDIHGARLTNVSQKDGLGRGPVQLIFQELGLKTTNPNTRGVERVRGARLSDIQLGADSHPHGEADGHSSLEKIISDLHGISDEIATTLLIVNDCFSRTVVRGEGLFYLILDRCRALHNFWLISGDVSLAPIGPALYLEEITRVILSQTELDQNPRHLFHHVSPKGKVLSIPKADAERMLLSLQGVLDEMKKLSDIEVLAWTHALPDIHDWLALHTMFYYKNEDCYEVRLKNFNVLARNSPKSLAMRLGLFGPHLRTDFKLDVDQLDILGIRILLESLLPYLRVKNEPHDGISKAVLNALMIPSPIEEEGKRTFIVAPGNRYYPERILDLLDEDIKMLRDAFARAEPEIFKDTPAQSLPKYLIYRDGAVSYVSLILLIEYNQSVGKDERLSFFDLVSGNPKAEKYLESKKVLDTSDFRSAIKSLVSRLRLTGFGARLSTNYFLAPVNEMSSWLSKYQGSSLPLTASRSSSVPKSDIHGARLTNVSQKDGLGRDPVLDGFVAGLYQGARLADRGQISYRHSHAPETHHGARLAKQEEIAEIDLRLRRIQARLLHDLGFKENYSKSDEKIRKDLISRVDPNDGYEEIPEFVIKRNSPAYNSQCARLELLARVVLDRADLGKRLSLCEEGADWGMLRLKAYERELANPKKAISREKADQILSELQKILDLMKASQNPKIQAWTTTLPSIYDWLSLPTTVFVRNYERYLRRIERFTELSSGHPESLAMRLGFFGPHLRADFNPAADIYDLWGAGAILKKLQIYLSDSKKTNPHLKKIIAASFLNAATFRGVDWRKNGINGESYHERYFDFCETDDEEIQLKRSYYAVLAEIFPEFLRNDFEAVMKDRFPNWRFKNQMTHENISELAQYNLKNLDKAISALDSVTESQPQFKITQALKRMLRAPLKNLSQRVLRVLGQQSGARLASLKKIKVIKGSNLPLTASRAPNNPNHADLGARLSISNVSPEGELGRGPVVMAGAGARLANESQDDQLILFTINVITAKHFYGKGEIVVGSDDLSVFIDPNNGEVILYGLSDRGISIKPKHVMLDRGKKKALIGFSLSDFKLLLDEADQHMQNFYENTPESFTNKPVVEILRTETVLPQDGYNPLAVKLLIGRLHQVRLTRQGRFVRFVIEGPGAELLPASEDFVLNPQNLPQKFQQAPRIHVVPPDQGATQFIAGDLYLYANRLGQADIFHPEIFDDASYLRRLDSLDPNNPHFVEFCRFFQAQLGHEIRSEDLPDFIKALEGRIQSLKRLQGFSLPPLLHLAIQQMIQTYNLMIKMTLQAA